MKKIIGLILALLVCFSFACPAYAEFVPSIGYKPEPEIIPVLNENGEEALGTVFDEEGEPIDYVEEICLVVTPVAHVWDEDVDVHEDTEDLLQLVYDGFSDGSMEIPYEKLGIDLEGKDLVIRDLFDVRWNCEEHPEMIDPDDVLFEVTFDLGVDADAVLYAMTYDEETGEWEPIVSTVNNGDGTVTCTFEHLCVVAFVTTAEAEAPAASSNGMMIWVAVLVLAAAGLIGILVVKNKKKASAK